MATLTVPERRLYPLPRYSKCHECGKSKPSTEYVYCPSCAKRFYDGISREEVHRNMVLWECSECHERRLLYMSEMPEPCKRGHTWLPT